MSGPRIVCAPLHIDVVDAPGGGQFGMSHCPGRSGGSYGQRRLETDLQAIETWGAKHLLTLVESHEFQRLGVPDFADAITGRAFVWHHLPIPDYGTPTAATMAAWQQGVDLKLAAALAQHERILVHCAAGLGRSGTMVAKLLVDLGMPPEVAITLVRTQRPGTIETDQQLAFVRQSMRLLP
jgi:protein-tyrosine phosphatase